MAQGSVLSGRPRLRFSVITKLFLGAGGFFLCSWPGVGPPSPWHPVPPRGLCFSLKSPDSLISQCPQLPVSPALLTLQLPSLFPPLVPLRPPLLDTSPSLPVPMLPSPTVFTRSYLSFQFQPK